MIWEPTKPRTGEQQPPNFSLANLVPTGLDLTLTDPLRRKICAAQRAAQQDVRAMRSDFGRLVAFNLHKQRNNARPWQSTWSPSIPSLCSVKAPCLVVLLCFEKWNQQLPTWTLRRQP